MEKRDSIVTKFHTENTAPSTVTTGQKHMENKLVQSAMDSFVKSWKGTNEYLNHGGTKIRVFRVFSGPVPPTLFPSLFPLFLLQALPPLLPPSPLFISPLWLRYCLVSCWKVAGFHCTLPCRLGLKCSQRSLELKSWETHLSQTCFLPRCTKVLDLPTVVVN